MMVVVPMHGCITSTRYDTFWNVIAVVIYSYIGETFCAAAYE